MHLCHTTSFFLLWTLNLTADVTLDLLGPLQVQKDETFLCENVDSVILELELLC